MSLGGSVQQVDRSFIGAGKVYAKIYGSSDELIHLGNIDEFNLTYEQETKKNPNYMGGGGVRNTLTRITSVNAVVGMYDLTPENIALVTQGANKYHDSVEIKDEVCTSGGVIGESISFETLPDLSKPVTIKLPDDTELKVGIDYEINKYGIVTRSNKVTSAGIKASYTSLNTVDIEMLLSNSPTLRLEIQGLNEAQNGEPYKLIAYKVKFGVTQNFAVFGQEYAKLSATIELLADDFIQSENISKFCYMKAENKNGK
ncbi:hypothetical protein VQ643_09480 [Pseudomonas sp. F1_0610]|uniref:phage tail tube protein n=1 Tax=Pseudomonas sp. F1_0610 TaxID=3114284 RepID=UPI0039C3149A